MSNLLALFSYLSSYDPGSELSVTISLGAWGRAQGDAHGIRAISFRIVAVPSPSHGL